jgi:hypothetical protein
MAPVKPTAATFSLFALATVNTLRIARAARVHAQNKGSLHQCDSKKPVQSDVRTAQIKAYYKAEIQLLAANEAAGMS